MASKFSTAPAHLPGTPLEALRALSRHPSPVILSALSAFFIGLRLWQGNWQWADAIAPVVILLWWPLQEWLIHVYLLHYRPIRLFGRIIDFPLPQKHRQHHREPWDISNIFIHKGVFLTVVPVLIALTYWLMPSATLATGALATFFTMALHYELCHFLAHIRWCPPLPYYQRRVRMHRLHHFRNESQWWGVSTGIGDIVLGTAPNPADIPRSLTTSQLHGNSTYSGNAQTHT